MATPDPSSVPGDLVAPLRALSSLAMEVADQRSRVLEILSCYQKAFAGGRTLFFAGNGGSAATAQHMAAEYVVRFAAERGAMRAVALTTDTSVLTAAANDLGFESIFARQIEALGAPGDVVSLHSTSGESDNLLHAAEAAHRLGMTVVGFLGRDGGRLRPLVDIALLIPSDDTSHIQELHLAVEHLIAGALEAQLDRESPQP